ncbi:hypothetical protein [Planobacterium oryzisoli]|uniref:Uncharacterized protein n=1 Tax=Planobacterium oryzisoli TaxID=2771435 RepID=A0A931E883_9FLAO|nr:hypothetical protein [Planobacterium oryzisoli]MBF5027576.1 hypothetical protein [Planobacterium oryzisoli]
MKYELSEKSSNLSSEKLWLKICGSLVDKAEIYSLTGKVYQLMDVSYAEIIYSSPSRNNGEPESILSEDCIAFLEILKQQNSFSTASIKELLPSVIYRKRSPLFAFLIAAGLMSE